MAYKPGPNQPDIQHDIKRPGALTQRAKEHGRSVSAEAKADEHKPGLAGQQARYYENVLRPASSRRKHSADGEGHWSGH